MAHRTKLHSLYNSYTFVDSDPSFGVHQDLQQNGAGQALISAWAQDGSPFAIAPRAGFQLKKVRA